MGANGLNVAQGVLGTCESDYQTLSARFRGLKASSTPIEVKIEATTGGGSNDEVNHIDIRTGTHLPQARYVFVADTEILIHSQQGGWNPADSKGEALSRLLAADAYPAIPGPHGYLTASSWLNSAREEWITKNEPTDKDFVSTGCAILFLNYLRTQIGFPLESIIARKRTLLSDLSRPYRFERCG